MIAGGQRDSARAKLQAVWQRPARSQYLGADGEGMIEAAIDPRCSDRERVARNTEAVDDRPRIHIVPTVVRNVLWILAKARRPPAFLPEMFFVKIVPGLCLFRPYIGSRHQDMRITDPARRFVHPPLLIVDS